MCTRLMEVPLGSEIKINWKKLWNIYDNDNKEDIYFSFGGKEKSQFALPNDGLSESPFTP